MECYGMMNKRVSDRHSMVGKIDKEVRHNNITRMARKGDKIHLTKDTKILGTQKTHNPHIITFFKEFWDQL
jgi:hypothetical protein